jgi:heme exporter protein A
MLEALHVSCNRGDRTLFSQLDLSLEGGRLLRVAGANGSGKTSLLRILCGLRAPEGGEVRWRGRSIALGEAREAFHAELVYVGHHNGLKDEFSAIENLESAAMLCGMAPARQALRYALERVGLTGQVRLPVRFFSQGQKRRLALARLVLDGPGEARPLWILDEPFNALDADGVALLEGLLAAHAAAGGMAVFTTHFEPSPAAGPIERVDLDDALRLDARRADALC